ncbi:hypothetical protein FGO68_gene1823 [Halteria grandinella]|uniref:Uncharacterized protein n=1 Tax=Halteria grandinella TaxID=5974 RepID=A0A8J8NWB6_HALGN|nr:hypothetical protein FGO68_gene1823 [Halteria grandinella]
MDIPSEQKLQLTLFEAVIKDSQLDHSFKWFLQSSECQQQKLVRGVTLCLAQLSFLETEWKVALFNENFIDGCESVSLLVLIDVMKVVGILITCTPLVWFSCKVKALVVLGNQIIWIKLEDVFQILTDDKLIEQV